MGMFDFIGDIGNKLFSADADDAAAGAAIQKHIEEDNPGINNLSVSVEDGVAKVSGDTDDSSIFEKAVLMAGNVFGVSSVNADELNGPALDDSVQYYEIAKGDTLWAVAEKFYNDGSQYTALFEANKEVIKDPDLIFPGQKIRVPAL